MLSLQILGKLFFFWWYESDRKEWNILHFLSTHEYYLPFLSLFCTIPTGANSLQILFLEQKSIKLVFASKDVKNNSLSSDHHSMQTCIIVIIYKRLRHRGEARSYSDKVRFKSFILAKLCSSACD